MPCAACYSAPMKTADPSSPHALAQPFLSLTDKTPALATDLRMFSAKVAAPTLAAKVRAALSYRQQGHFDKAMLAMSEANRDQVLALRKIQSTLSGVTGTNSPMVVFERFRQRPPFEIGVADGDGLFTILERLGATECPALDEARTKLHALEAQIEEERAFVALLERQPKSNDNTAETEATRATAQNLERTLAETRVNILNPIFAVTKDVLDRAAVRRQRDNLFLSLAANIYVVVMSSIATKPAQRVAVRAMALSSGRSMTRLDESAA